MSADAPRAVIIGAGLGGLTTAALLLQAGQRVTVLEAQSYPGGCAGTFYHQGYRFDVGATLAGGFGPGGPHARLAAALGQAGAPALDWPVRPADPAWLVHLPDLTIIQWTERERWQAERQAAFPGSETFWRRQESLAGAAWDVSARPFPWPPASARDWATLAAALRPRTLLTAPFALRSVADLARGADPRLRTFLDAQLLISAQTTADHANALYGSAALDLPRRGVYHARGGMGALAATLVDWIRAMSGEVLLRQRVVTIEARAGRAVAVRTKKGLRVPCERLAANVTPQALRGLLGQDSPSAQQPESHARPDAWGAFTLYLGLEAAALPAGVADHHQVVVDPAAALGEGNSVYITLSDPADPTRAPSGRRAAMLSTHTVVGPWWQAYGESWEAYEARKAEYTERLLSAAGARCRGCDGRCGCACPARR